MQSPKDLQRIANNLEKARSKDVEGRYFSAWGSIESLKAVNNGIPGWDNIPPDDMIPLKDECSRLIELAVKTLEGIKAELGEILFNEH